MTINTIVNIIWRVRVKGARRVCIGTFGGGRIVDDQDVKILKLIHGMKTEPKDKVF